MPAPSAHSHERKAHTAAPMGRSIPPLCWQSSLSSALLSSCYGREQPGQARAASAPLGCRRRIKMPRVNFAEVVSRLAPSASNRVRSCKRRREPDLSPSAAFVEAQAYKRAYPGQNRFPTPRSSSRPAGPAAPHTPTEGTPQHSVI